MLLERVEVVRHGRGRYRVNQDGEPPTGGYASGSREAENKEQAGQFGVVARAAAPAVPGRPFFARHGTVPE